MMAQVQNLYGHVNLLIVELLVLSTVCYSESKIKYMPHFMYMYIVYTLAVSHALACQIGVVSNGTKCQNGSRTCQGI